MDWWRPKRYGIVLCARFGSSSWLVQINDVSDYARQKRRGEEGGSSLVTDFFEKICSNLFKPTLRRHK